jgi:predicted RNase H-like nuclease (RuvC/YqgF family)
MSDDLTIAYMLGVEDMRSRLHKQADEIERLRAENEKLHREAAIRIDQLEREQEAHLRTIADYNRAAVENEKLREALNGWQEWWELPWQDKRPDIAELIYRRAAAAIRESGDE